ncbi:hypothetical protein EON64_02090 [archaeon]|nr:MAG: hypothetical protein EON64_02090 [archaeon]
MKGFRFLGLALVVVPFAYWALCTDNYILEFIRTIIRANTAIILPPQPVKWLQRPTKARNVPARTLQGKKPNIILIVADDLGHNDLSGGADVATPHIDSIGHNGVEFLQSYSAQATCAPSRAALLTGRMPTSIGFEFTPTPKFFGKMIGDMSKLNKVDYAPLFRSEKFNECPEMDSISLPPDVPLLPEMLRDLGYRNFFLGKWDSGFHSPHTPVDRGYDESLAFLLGAVPYAPGGSADIVSATNQSLDNLLLRITNFHIVHNNGPRFQPDQYMTDYLSEQAVELIRALYPHSTDASNGSSDNQTNANEAALLPFFITLAYNAPHNPFQALRSDYDSLSHIASPQLRIYAAMIQALDRGVGAVLQALREAGQDIYDNTLVIFTSDNGGASYVKSDHVNAPFRGFKASFFEGGIRVPLLWQWPARIAAGTVYEEPVISMDIVASILDAARGNEEAEEQSEKTQPPTLDGMSLLPLLPLDGIGGNNQHGGEQRVLFWRSGDFRALRLGNHKVLTHLHPNKVWYFNLLLDPTERTNLATERLNVTSATEAQALSKHAHVWCGESYASALVADDTDSMSHASLLCQLFSLLHRLEEVDSKQHAPLWPSLTSIPFCIDKHAGFPCRAGEEYTYFDN